MRILITGGTGFLGRRLALDLRDENQVTIAGRNNAQNVVAEQVTGCAAIALDVTNIESVRDAMVQVRPDVIIHAAATKYVDLAERQPLECIDVNIVGSENVARVARERGVRAVVGISTDKAAPPVRNTYGLSKALMERLFCALDDPKGTRFTCVRFGNIAWSTGSVLPTWKAMHERDGVIGTTGPEMRRFFFTVSEASELVRTAFDHLDDVAGGVLARTMKCAQIRDILDVWIARRGGRWERIQPRPGEREDEALIGEPEHAYTREVHYRGVRHFIIRFNERAASPVASPLTSANAERLTTEEIARLIESAPHGGN